jgi:hypothetical protein
MQFNDFWNSIEKLGSLVTAANWGVAATLLIGFACTVVAIKASSRKDQLTNAENLHKAEHIAKLDNANLTLRGQVATLETNAANADKGLAELQKAASDAKAAQQQVEIDLAKQQEKTATAERQLADLKETIRPRRLTEEQQTALIGLLSGTPKGKVSITCVMGDGEGKAFATQVDAVLKSAGWTTSGVSQGVFSPDDPVGFGIRVRSAISAPPWARRLQEAFFSIGTPMEGVENPEQTDGTVEIVVGRKPNP